MSFKRNFNEVVRDRVINIIKTYKMVDKGDGVIVGFSGGPDSTCLLHVLNSLKETLGIRIYAVHLNHMIRDEEALRDEEYSRTFALSLGIPYYSRRLSVIEYARENKLSSEEAGRKLRYDFFNEIAKETRAEKIALAHNMNDQAETMLMHFFRGSGISGIGGIRPVRGKYIRPIISCSREEIEGYCIENNLNPVIDSTNKEAIYTRNRVRLELIPYIEEKFNPNIIENLYKTSEIIRDEDDYLNMFAKEKLQQIKHNGGILIASFNKLHIALKRRIIRILIEEERGNLTGYEGKHIENCIELISKGYTGKIYDLPLELQCVIQYDIFKIQKKNEKRDFEYHITVPGNIYIEEIKLGISARIIEKDDINYIDKNFVKYFDYDKIKGELFIRNRRDGDYIYPKGMMGRKKIKDIFIDKKVPRDLRERMPLLALDSEILWIMELRDTNNYKPNEETKNILEIKILRGVTND